MAKRNKSTEGGLELDKLNLTNFSLGSSRKPASPEQTDGRTPSPPRENRRQDNKSSLLLMGCLLFLAILMALTALFKNQDYSFQFSSGKQSSDAPLGNYLRVGPVTATLANEDIIKFSIDIDCRTAKLKEQLAGKDSRIRDEIVTVLTEPGTETLIKKHDYEAVKTKIKKRLGDLGAGSIDNIYFSELLLY